MTNNLVGLAYVLAASLVMFTLCRPLMLQHMSASSFEFRRNMWLGTTVLVFASPNYWVFVVPFILLILFARTRETNPLALFLMLWHAVPAKEVQLPAIGSITLIAVNNFMLLSAFLLLPALVGQGPKTPLARRGSDKSSLLRNQTLFWILIFGAVQILFWSSTESATHSLRRATIFGLSTVLVFVAFSRLPTNREQLMEALMSMLMGIALMGGIAIIESNKQWLIYSGVAAGWGPVTLSEYVLRDGGLRVQVAAGHSIIFGNLMACALVLIALHRDKAKQSFATRTLVLSTIAALSLYYARSRAPWIGALAGIIVYLGMTPNASSRLPKLLGLTVLAVGILAMTPSGEKLAAYIPFIGEAESNNIVYRQNMNLALWNLTLQSPIMGNPMFVRELEDLRQGQGIIDLLNVYLVNGAAFGLTGMLTFVAPLLLAIWASLRNIRAARVAGDSAQVALNAGLLGLLVNHCLFMYTASYMASVAILPWILAGLAVSPGAADTRSALAPS